jgi:hypothetical protein
MDDSTKSDSILSPDSSLTSTSSEEYEEYDTSPFIYPSSDPIDISTTKKIYLISTYKKKQLKKIVKSIKEIQHSNNCYLITLDANIQNILVKLTTISKNINKIDADGLINKVEQSIPLLSYFLQKFYAELDNLALLINEFHQKQQSTIANNYDTLPNVYTNIPWPD